MLSIIKNLLLSSINPYMLYVKLIGGGLIIAGLIYAYISFVDNIKRSAILEFKTIQLEQIMKDKQNEIDNLQNQLDNTNKILSETNTQNIELSDKLSNMRNELNSKSHKDDNTVSDVINETLQNINKSRGK